MPLAQLADVRFDGGPPRIKSENALLNSIVYVGVRGRDIGSYVEDARALLGERLTLPTGYRLEWSGQFEAMERANRTLRIVVPITLGIILLLFYINFRSVPESLIVMLSVPFALVGSVWLLWALDYNISVTVWVGLIALAGVAAEIAIVLLVYLNEAYERHEREGRLRTREELLDAVREGAGERVRPVLTTATAVIAGLLPILWGDGTGSTVMKRIAAPMVGGMVSATVLTLVVVPALYSLWREWQRREAWSADPTPAPPIEDGGLVAAGTRERGESPDRELSHTPPAPRVLLIFRALLSAAGRGPGCGRRSPPAPA